MSVRCGERGGGDPFRRSERTRGVCRSISSGTARTKFLFGLMVKDSGLMVMCNIIIQKVDGERSIQGLFRERERGPSHTRGHNLRKQVETRLV